MTYCKRNFYLQRLYSQLTGDKLYSHPHFHFWEAIYMYSYKATTGLQWGKKLALEKI